MAVFLFRNLAIAQIPVEIFAGNQRTTVDIMFFKFIKSKDGDNSKFLFFNRNRAGIDHMMADTKNLPLFGFTEALSYNHKKLKGIAPVVVASILNSGVFPKAGIQYANVKKDYTIFSWVVSEIVKEPNIDFFFLGRYTPKLSNDLHLFSQMELVNAFPTHELHNFSFTQRFRLGLKLKGFQFGGGLDLIQIGRSEFTKSKNIGGFLRYEF